MNKPIVQPLKGRHLIIGQGSVGQPVAECLAKVGHDVTAIARTPKHHDECVQFWQKDAKTLAADELTPFSHIAIIISPNHNCDRVQAYRDSYLAVCEHLAGLTLPRVRRVLFVSSTSVYGESAGEMVDIHTPAFPKTQTAKVLIQAENILKQAFGERCVIVRPSGIYDAHSVRMRHLAKNAHVDGVPAMHYTNRIHRDDLIAVLCRVLGSPVCEPLYLASDCKPTTSLRVLEFLCQKYGYPKPAVIEGQPTGKRIRGNVDDWLVFRDYQLGYQDAQ